MEKNMANKNLSGTWNILLPDAGTRAGSVAELHAQLLERKHVTSWYYPYQIIVMSQLQQ